MTTTASKKVIRSGIPAIQLEDWAIEIGECARVTKKVDKPFCSFLRRPFVKR